MKKIVFVLVAVLSLTLTSCSWFDSEPIEPNILGVSHLQYDAKSGLWFVTIDSTQYTIARITIPDHNPHSYGTTQDIEPVEGMIVTVFTSPHKTGIQAVMGEQSVEQIEELYHTNITAVFVFCGLMFLSALIIAWPTKRRRRWTAISKRCLDSWHLFCIEINMQK